eukprot:scaffold6337_cov126-Skeletonema_marinoi.AAC.2
MMMRILPGADAFWWKLTNRWSYGRRGNDGHRACPTEKVAEGVAKCNLTRLDRARKNLLPQPKQPPTRPTCESTPPELARTNTILNHSHY